MRSPEVGRPAAGWRRGPDDRVGACLRRLLLTAVELALLLALGSAVSATAAAGPRWLDAAGRPNASARDGLRLLARAGDDGLSPQDYGAADLAGRATALDAAHEAAPAAGATFERDLETALLRYFHDLHAGRVDPRALGFRVATRGIAAPDAAAQLHAAAAAGRLAEAAASLRPRFVQYEKLREALARYRTLASGAAPERLPDNATVQVGDAYAGAAALQRRLVAYGDLPEAGPAPGPRYDAALAEGVERFQRRHGLPATGMLGRATLAALNVPLSRRVQQLELALERLRWLPDWGTQPVIGINIPMFRLWARDPAAPDGIGADMQVVVGRALNTQTPVLADELRYVVFRPYWNVPRSILLHDVLPALERDPAYLQRNDMEIVRGAGDDAQPVAASPGNLALLRQGSLRVRQRPGPKNSLGLVKFIFPNDDNVYLHGTPATQLFERARRDFSHGCVRVQDPVALAQWVLRDPPRWTRARIEAAMAATVPQRVDLARPIPVVLYYLSAMVMPGDGLLHFADDIYGHDARLARALRRTQAAG